MRKRKGLLRRVRGRKRLIKHSMAIRVLGYSSVTVLSLLTLALLFPYAPQNTVAESCLDNPTAAECRTALAETKIGATVNTAISIAMSPSVEMDLAPTSIGAASSTSTKLNVSTNNNNGYALYMQTGSEDGSLKSTSSSNTYAIHNTSQQNVTLNNLEKNSYGYALTESVVSPETTYSNIPTAGGIIKKTTTTTPSGENYPYGDTYYLSFGVNIGTDIQAGTYEGSVIVSAVANPKTLSTMFDLDYMQDMTSEICAETREGYTKQLIDTRDGKKYWVAKLKDGNCWMTQNLAYTITQEMIDNNSINSINTDLHPNDPALANAGQLQVDSDGIVYWNNSNSVTYKPTVTKDSIVAAQPKTTYSWNFGNYVILNPSSMEMCISDRLKENQSSAISVLPGQSFSQCVNLVDITGWSPTFRAQEKQIVRPDFVRKTVAGYYPDSSTTNLIYVPLSETGGDFDKDENGNYIPYSYSGLVTVDFENRTYDPHYLIGNYYQLNSATAGTAGAYQINNGTFPSTICPKGWTLPSIRASAGKNIGGYISLFQSYGDDNYQQTADELYFFRSGVLTSDSMRQIGGRGDYLYRNANGFPDDATALSLREDRVIYLASQESFGRRNGKSLRCLAR